MTGSLPVSATRAPFGQLSDGSIVEAITLAAECGISTRILSYGATLQSLFAPDANGVLADIVLGHDDVAGYDHNFVRDKGLTVEPQFAARLEDPHSGRRLDVLTTEPGLQLLTTNWLHGTVRGDEDGSIMELTSFPAH